MKVVGNGVHSLYYKTRFTPIDADARLFVKEYKLHWWSKWKLMRLKSNNDHDYAITYMWDEMTQWYKPTNGWNWNEQYHIK